MSATTTRPAVEADIEAVLRLAESLYAEDGTVPFRRSGHREAIEALLGSPELGRLYAIDDRGLLVGYAVLTWGFSLEDGGRNAVLDEFFILPDHGGRGLGSRALAELEADCRQHGARALHIQVERENVRAQRLYLARGYHAHDRLLLTKPFSGESTEP